MNDSNEVRLDLIEEISERGATSGTLGAVSITKRNATTTVVVRDQQTVVIGGLMRDSLATAQKKVPILGDIPVLGFLFRSTETSIRKTNLLLVLTPYVIRNQDDLRTVFERKMQERQEFLDRYFVFSDQQNYEPPTDYSRLNGLLEDIRQSYLSLDERKRLMEKTAKRPLKTHEPGEPIEMPEIRRPSSSGAHSAGGAPTGGDAPKDGGTKRPAVLSPGSRSTAPASPAPAAPKTE
jgi:general secretion pathway protein D